MQILQDINTRGMELIMKKSEINNNLTAKITRRDFLGFFLFGGLINTSFKKINNLIDERHKKAMFWRKIDGK